MVVIIGRFFDIWQLFVNYWFRSSRWMARKFTIQIWPTPFATESFMTRTPSELKASLWESARALLSKLTAQWPCAKSRSHSAPSYRKRCTVFAFVMHHATRSACTFGVAYAVRECRSDWWRRERWNGVTLYPLDLPSQTDPQFCRPRPHHFFSNCRVVRPTQGRYFVSICYLLLEFWRLGLYNL